MRKYFYFIKYVYFKLSDNSTKIYSKLFIRKYFYFIKYGYFRLSDSALFKSLPY